MPCVVVDEIFLRPGQVWRWCQLLDNRVGRRRWDADHVDIVHIALDIIVGTKGGGRIMVPTVDGVVISSGGLGLCHGEPMHVITGVGMDDVHILNIIETLDAFGAVAGHQRIVFAVKHNGAAVRTWRGFLRPTMDLRMCFGMILEGDNSAADRGCVDEEYLVDLASHRIPYMGIALAVSLKCHRTL